MEGGAETPSAAMGAMHIGGGEDAAEAARLEGERRRQEVAQQLAARGAEEEEDEYYHYEDEAEEEETAGQRLQKLQAAAAGVAARRAARAAAADDFSNGEARVKMATEAAALAKLEQSNERLRLEMNAHLQAMNGIADIAGVLLSENMFGADEGGETESVAEAMAAAEKNKRERQAFEDGRKAVKQYGEAADRKRVNRAKARAHKAKIHRMRLVDQARTGGAEGDAEQILDDVLAETEEAAPLNALLAAKMKAAADVNWWELPEFRRRRDDDDAPAVSAAEVVSEVPASFCLKPYHRVPEPEPEAKKLAKADREARAALLGGM